MCYNAGNGPYMWYTIVNRKSVISPTHRRVIKELKLLTVIAWLSTVSAEFDDLCGTDKVSFILRYP